MAVTDAGVDVLPDPVRIAEARKIHHAHVRAESKDTPVRYRLFEADGHGSVDMLVHADHTVTLGCGCHEPVIEDGVILGLRRKGTDGAH